MEKKVFRDGISFMSSDNFIQTFQLESSSLRGRIVRLGTVLDDILGAHDYPLPISHLVAENITLTLLLSSMLKYKGIFTLQVQGDGPVRMIVSDMTSEGVVRGCASFNEERFEKARAQIGALKTQEGSQNHLAQYMGSGYIAFTVDQEHEKDRYQGIVELKGSSMVDCVQHYFTQSEQIRTGIKMAVGQRDGYWCAGAIMLQHMPEDDQEVKSNLGNLNEDDWRRAMIFLDTCTEDEFLDKGISAQDLLLRLFHEEGVRVFEPMAVAKGCRCTPERVENVLLMMGDDDLAYMAVDDDIEMVCEFCSRKYVFPLKEIKDKLRAAQKES
jgi:molecular chaperone Hsp33